MFSVCRHAFVDRYAPGTTNVFWAGLETDMITEGKSNIG